jgi:hypothetical protein
MLEIVNDLAPGAQLFFATGNGSPSSMAANILNLRFTYGCDVIVDDISYFNESPFQDGVIAQAVNGVTTNGGLYFSSAANSGNLDSGTSGTWEGDFLNGGAAGSPVNGKGGFVHNFGSANYDTVTTASGNGSDTVLFWSDPLGAATDDYDLFILNSTGTTIISSSTTVQNGSQDPYEQVPAPSAGQRVVVVLASGSGRFLHLDTQRGVLSTGTQGSTRGHNAATNAFTVAATAANNSYPNPFTGGVANPVETFSSDGPRRMFYLPNGTPFTPGNLSSTGGAVFQKPDITAADGVTTDVPGFASFYGTSAAAPHAAAIAALLKSYNPLLNPAQMRQVLTNTALDIMAAGFDRDSGAGIVMALAALQSTFPDALQIRPRSAFSASGPVGGPFSSTSQDYSLTNGGATSLSWSLINTSLWLTASAGGSTLTPGGPATNVTVSLNSTASNLVAGIYAATLTFSNQSSHVPQSLLFNLQVGQSLVQNGGFETGNFSSWTLTGSDTFSFVDTSSSVSIPSHSGTCFAALGASGPSLAFLSQTLSTVPGQAYLLSMWLYSTSINGGIPNEFSVSWNGGQIFDWPNVGVVTWTNLQFIVTATGSNTVLQLGEYDNPWYLGLDDVNVWPIPNPSFRSVAKMSNSNAVVFTWNSLAGLAYQVQYSTNLIKTNWIILSTNTATGPILTFTNSYDTDPQRFYRIRRLP